jgi:3D (Asp-Asp-Asp) domain-containing protein
VPFGAGLYIDGVGARVSQDRTARRYDGRFDVYFTRHADAKAFGKRRRRIIIVY